MSLREVFRLAFESLLSNRLRAGLTMLGMIIGVGAVVLLVSIGNGAKNYITGQFESLGTNFIVIQPGKRESKSGFGPPMGMAKQKLTLGDVDALEKTGMNLDAVSGLMFGNGAAQANDKKKNISIMGTNEQFNRIFKLDLQFGEYLSKEEADNGRRVAVIGFNIASELFGAEAAVGRQIKLNDVEHRVIGVVHRSGEKLGLNIDEMAIVPTRSAMRIFNEDKLFGIRAKSKSKVSLNDAVSEIRDILKARHNGEEDFTVVTQSAMLDTMNTILGMLTYVLGGIAMISMLVGGIGIMNIMLVSVTERTREIGIRRAVGARRADVLRQFLYEAIVLAVTGGMLGLMGSAGITYLLYWAIPSFDMRAPVWILVPAFLLSVVIGVVFGVWPARRAAQIETIDALRFE